MKLVHCPEYCGVACVNGSCPNALHEICPDIYKEVSCENCFEYKGCKDCTAYGCDEELIMRYGDRS